MGLCIVSKRFRFVCLLIGKNATSTLRYEFHKPFYESYECDYDSLDSETSCKFFTFAFLRDPVSRLLSAYQEVSMRNEMGEKRYQGRKFFEMEDSRERFEVFLDDTSRYKWDGHLRDQVAYVANARVDFFGSVESFQQDIERIYALLGLATCPLFPKQRSREGRKEVYHYDKFLIFEEDLDEGLVERIRDVYREDEELYRRTILNDSGEQHSPVGWDRHQIGTGGILR